MTRQLPRLHPERDQLKQTILLVNQLRENTPDRGYLMIPVGPINLLETGTTLAIQANVPGFATDFINVVPRTVTGALTVSPEISIGANVTFDDIVAVNTLGGGLALAEKKPIALPIVANLIASTDPIYINVVTAATGYTTLTAVVYFGGYYLL